MLLFFLQDSFRYFEGRAPVNSRARRLYASRKMWTPCVLWSFCGKSKQTLFPTLRSRFRMATTVLEGYCQVVSSASFLKTLGSIVSAKATCSTAFCRPSFRTNASFKNKQFFLLKLLAETRFHRVRESRASPGQHSPSRREIPRPEETFRKGMWAEGWKRKK